MRESREAGITFRTMTDQLFDMPESPAPELERARTRLMRARAAYDRAAQSDEDFDGFGEVAYREETAELDRALRYLSACEARAMRK